jgi:hypothetical protein
MFYMAWGWAKLVRGRAYICMRSTEIFTLQIGSRRCDFGTTRPVISRSAQ